MKVISFPKCGLGRLQGKALKIQNQAIIARDGDRCGICRCYPPASDGHQNPNHFPAHHNLYPEKTDIMSEKISACPMCHAQLHIHHAIIDGELVNLKDKASTQEWVRNRIKQIERGEV
jgi:hypothetical protein